MYVNNHIYIYTIVQILRQTKTVVFIFIIKVCVSTNEHGVKGENTSKEGGI